MFCLLNGCSTVETPYTYEQPTESKREITSKDIINQVSNTFLEPIGIGEIGQHIGDVSYYVERTYWEPMDNFRTFKTERVSIKIGARMDGYREPQASFYIEIRY